jgi:hypothetical protein
MENFGKSLLRFLFLRPKQAEDPGHRALKHRTEKEYTSLISKLGNGIVQAF